jgi:hypothetical protein
MADVCEIKVVKTWIEVLRLKREEIIRSKGNLRIEAIVNNSILEKRILLRELSGGIRQVGSEKVVGVSGKRRLDGGENEEGVSGKESGKIGAWERVGGRLRRVARE